MENSMLAEAMEVLGDSVARAPQKTKGKHPSQYGGRKTLYTVHKKIAQRERSKYPYPHQGSKEKARRLGAL